MFTWASNISYIPLFVYEGMHACLFERPWAHVSDRKHLSRECMSCFLFLFCYTSIKYLK
jgi:hypothetical protein